MKVKNLKVLVKEFSGFFLPAVFHAHILSVLLFGWSCDGVMTGILIFRLIRPLQGLMR